MQATEQSAAPAATQLQPGEIDVGIVAEDGRLENAQRVILLPGAAEGLTWQQAKEWAAQQGGDLPTRMEMLLLLKTQREQFERDWYWANESHADDDAYAWYQYFGWGTQGYWHEDGVLRARAVRRIVL